MDRVNCDICNRSYRTTAMWQHKRTLKHRMSMRQQQIIIGEGFISDDIKIVPAL